MSLIDMTKYFVRRDLSGSEIETLVGKPPVLYSDLEKYKSITQLLTKNSPYVVLLYQNTKFQGHYVSLFLDQDGCINFQDSYGYLPDEPINQGMLPYDAPLKRYLTKLIDASGLKLISNKIDYQSSKHGYADCGRHACLRILLRNLSNAQYANLMTKSVRTVPFLTSDHIAVILTLSGLDDIEQFDNKKESLQRITK